MNLSLGSTTPSRPGPPGGFFGPLQLKRRGGGVPPDSADPRQPIRETGLHEPTLVGRGVGPSPPVRGVDWRRPSGTALSGRGPSTLPTRRGGYRRPGHCRPTTDTDRPGVRDGPDGESGDRSLRRSPWVTVMLNMLSTTGSPASTGQPRPVVWRRTPGTHGQRDVLGRAGLTSTRNTGVTQER
jgi:hypothetical protein